MGTTVAWHADDALLARYVAGTVDAVTAASLEQHLLGCSQCRVRIAGHVEVPPLEAVWEAVRERVEPPRLPLLGRLLRWVGLAESEALLVSAASSLRASWLAGVAVVLVFAASAALWGGPRGLSLFLLVAPLVPVAGVVAAYGPVVDPLYEVSGSAPYPRARLVLLRSGAVLASSLPPALALGVLLPGPVWLAAAWLLPALAFVVVVLAVSTWVDPVAAGVGVALAWTLMTAAAALRRAPTALVEPAVQPVYLVLGLSALAVLLLRLRNPDALGRTP